ncbi:unnamed protein product [Didymodactylos carnosus]|uniref:Glycosyl transferase CAP10 domain-containing protein n=1 Tax=Didymodactylos carnosus TaxID=1234261 RepID=A0A814J5E5_9BILA|nr:unnamed protein product [Didymodactylos carnosus]CAF1059576.1 unnamed protein product [Didymodactylos carnosus]CAF3804322.1 unnamed protein product [Didymodactylos carnosus]CAF3825259.1 unnamed protein product [Didymodactylos carnosus]
MLFTFYSSIHGHSQNNCSPDDLECHEKSKYLRDENEKWNKYIQLINDAEQRHVNNTQDGTFLYMSQIQSDLAYWKTKQDGITRNDIEQSLTQPKQTLYQIINHRLYRCKDEDLIFPFRNYGVEHFILNILQELPDMEFILNTYDWPQTYVHNSQQHLPIFSFSKVKQGQHLDILYPAWSFWDGGPALGSVYPTGIGRWDLMRETLNNARKKIPWSKKQSIGFFRGSRTSDERDPLVILSREKPYLLDAQYTKNQAWKSDSDTLGAPPASEMRHEAFCPYKYLFNFRGIAASFRLRHLFLCGSLVFHVGDEWIEFFYPYLEPWYHYIPVTSDLRDVEQLLLFAQHNDKLMAKIAKHGREFIWKHLRMSDIDDYWKHLLVEYQKLLNYTTPIVKRKDFYEVKRRK